MWRRGDVAYAAAVLAALVVEAGALAVVTGAFLLRRVGVLPGWRALDALTLATCATALVLTALGGWVLAYHAWSELAARRAEARVAAWIERWTRHVIEDAP